MGNSSNKNLRSQLEVALTDRFHPAFLEVQDDSGRHVGHVGNTSGGGHFQVTLVSEAFEQKSLMERHRMVHEALRKWMGKDIHALALKTLSPSEYQPSN